jgi:hypothetical protein
MVVDLSLDALSFQSSSRRAPTKDQGTCCKAKEGDDHQDHSKGQPKSSGVFWQNLYFML